ncbi:MAG TPA: hypothetical protein VGR02_06630 [Thermoanaerobaculia bacterium]|jgi:hypothetical protein|nr:hypothetical protein [Thermoanaerobaculia bacterium]
MTDSILDLPASSSPRSEPLAAAGAVVPREELSARDREQMFALFSAYFAGVTRQVFERDLEEKEWVIVLRDERGAIDGFSTLMRFEHEGRTVFFSGDTIVAEERRGTPELSRLWVNHVRAAARRTDGEVYWFLISSGYRTYRFLPVFFRDFHPRFDRRSPSLASLLEGIAIRRFGEAYDRESGIVRLANPSPLRTPHPEGRAAHDPHVRFFLAANPGHARGDELACLVRVAEDNLTPAGARMLR